VADILAQARSGKTSGEKPAPQKSTAKAMPAAKAKPAEQFAAKGAAASKTKTAQGSATTSAPRDTASILAAARKSTKSGPISKAEAASQAKSRPGLGAKGTAAQGKLAQGKPKLIVPPMPARPAYVTRALEKPSASRAKGGRGKSSVDADRRIFMGVGFVALGGVLTLWTLETVRFMFPNVLREPPSKFKVGYRDGFPAGQVQTKYKAQYGIWVVNTQYHGEQQLVALKSVCTHLGCTPNWLEAEQKFKCPCHGSGFYKDGINFEGPAPRPLERYAIQIADDGQVEIDKSRTFQEEMGEWNDPACFILV
jgi:cytochrome b6-f complex iron-sulfur subunit